MPRYERFTFACDAEERRILVALARRLERSQSDAVRWLIRRAAAEFGATDPAPAPQPAPVGVAHAAEPA